MVTRASFGDMTPRRLRRAMNLWPPFAFSGVRVLHISDDWREARVALRLRRWNRNYVGTQFGGALFAMTDPFWMLLMMKRLGRDYVVWDRAAEIRFLAPGRGDVFARFVLDDARVASVRRAAGSGRVLDWFEVEITTATGQVVAVVRKQLYVRRKDEQRATAGT
jgi:acyl-coenzyme A thioesterase PaaI-like protein